MPTSSPTANRRRDQIHAVDLELDSFQRLLSDLLLDLSSDPNLLSLSWIRKLLDSLLISQEHFRTLIFSSDSHPLLSRPPLHRLLSDYFDRAIKALDLCNALRDGIDRLRQWRHHIDIVLATLNPRTQTLTVAHLRRARKALTDLTISMLDENDASVSSAINHRNRSFGRPGGGKDSSPRSFRSLSWSVSRSWSAARQIQAIGSNVVAPKAAEVAASGGLVVPVYSMSVLLLFVMWALVAGIPCQDRGLQLNFPVARNFQWADPVLGLYERIVEESKRKDRKNCCGLMREIVRIEKCTRQLAELMEPIEAPMTEEREIGIRRGVEELESVCSELKEGLDPLERQVREVFRRIVRSRSEGLDCMSRSLSMES